MALHGPASRKLELNVGACSARRALPTNRGICVQSNRMPQPPRNGTRANENRNALPGGDADQRFRILVESVKDYAIFMLDLQGRIQSWNVGAEIIKGYKAQEIIGKSIEVFYPPEDRARGLPARLLAQAATDGR